MNDVNWFHYATAYDMLASKLRSGDTFVEIGCLYGKSTIYMAKRLQQLGKDVVFFAIDKFVVDEESEDYLQAQITTPKYFDIFIQNLELAGVRDMVIPVMGDSAGEAAYHFDKSVRAIMFDGDHSYEGLQRDLVAWMPKMRDDAIITGDDYEHPGFPGLKKAVDEYFSSDMLTLVPSTDKDTNHKIWIVDRSDQEDVID
jgi:predicted O-methyltransferase YrrM